MKKVKIGDVVVNHLDEVGRLVEIKPLPWGHTHKIEILEPSVFSKVGEIVESREEDLKPFKQNKFTYRGEKVIKPRNISSNLIKDIVNECGKSHSITVQSIINFISKRSPDHKNKIK